MAKKRIPTVLVTNDDGPPSDDSPYVYGLVKELQNRLGWTDIRVVLPSSQKSWISAAYMIKDRIDGQYFYPTGDEGREGETSATQRPEGGEGAEWILLNGTPATCANIALNNLFPGEIDLCVSGPNYGRNTSTAFALSSGTVGAALSASLCGVPAIALSYGLFQKPVDPAIITEAHRLAALVLDQLWQKGFSDDSDPALYNVNIPLLPGLAQHQETPIRWTTLAQTQYGRLFAPVDQLRSPRQKEAERLGPAPVSPSRAGPPDSAPPRPSDGKLAFKFAPDLSSLVTPNTDSLVDGTDIHAISHCVVSVTRLKAAFAAAEVPASLREQADAKGQWKL